MDLGKALSLRFSPFSLCDDLTFNRLLVHILKPNSLSCLSSGDLRFDSGCLLSLLWLLMRRLYRNFNFSLCPNCGFVFLPQIIVIFLLQFDQFLDFHLFPVHALGLFSQEFVRFLVEFLLFCGHILSFARVRNIQTLSVLDKSRYS